MMDYHGELVLQPLRNSQPVQVIMHQPWQTMLVLLSPSDQTCCSIHNRPQLVCDSHRCRSKHRVAVIDPRCDTAWTIIFTDSTSNDRRTWLNWQSQKETCLTNVWQVLVKTEVCNVRWLTSVIFYLSSLVLETGIHTCSRIDLWNADIRLMSNDDHWLLVNCLETYDITQRTC